MECSQARGGGGGRAQRPLTFSASRSLTVGSGVRADMAARHGAGPGNADRGRCHRLRDGVREPLPRRLCLLLLPPR